MSKYTTEVRFLCESLTGHTESEGFNSVDEILTQAAPLIFSFSFPLYDEDYRLVLEKKILRHYYTREISEETYGLWKLRLEDRMNVIMPYYNQLYRSALLTFNPFYDVDLTTEHEGNQNGVVNSNESDRINTQNKVDKKGNEVENYVKNTTNNNVENNHLTHSNDHTGTVKDDNIGEHVIVNNDASTENNTGNRNENKNTNYENINVENDNATTTNNETGTSNNTQWDLFSDTPQGGINGLGVPNSSAPSSDLENNIYLTTARKVTDNGGTTRNANQANVSTNVGNESGSGAENNTENTSVHTDNISNRVENGNRSESNVKTYNERNQQTNSGSIENVNSGVEVNDGGRSNAENISSNGVTSNDAISTKVSANTDEYLQKVVGKSGGMTYSAMLLEYRKTFINIDEMIIEELSDLFFGLW